MKSSRWPWAVTLAHQHLEMPFVGILVSRLGPLQGRAEPLPSAPPPVFVLVPFWIPSRLRRCTPAVVPPPHRHTHDRRRPRFDASDARSAGGARHWHRSGIRLSFSGHSAVPNSLPAEATPVGAAGARRVWVVVERSSRRGDRFDGVDGRCDDHLMDAADAVPTDAAMERAHCRNQGRPEAEPNRQRSLRQRAGEPLRPVTAPWRCRGRSDIERLPIIPDRSRQMEWFDAQDLAVATNRARPFPGFGDDPDAETTSGRCRRDVGRRWP